MSLIRNMLARAVVKLIGDSGGRQTAQLEVTKGELIDDVPRIQQYGLTGNPPSAGTDAIVIFLGGDREQGMIIAMENQAYRIAGLQTGEVALYDDLGNVVKLGREQLEVTATIKLVATAPDVEITATGSAKIAAGASSITITPSGVAISSATLTHNGKNIGATHIHTQTQPGTGNSGVPA